MKIRRLIGCTSVTVILLLLVAALAGGVYQRLFRLFYQTEEPSRVAGQIQDLRHTLFSLIQEVEVLKGMLREQGAWDERRHRQLGIESMLADRSSAGADPWRRHSPYRYTLDEEEFLREELGLGERELAEFRARSEELGLRPKLGPSSVE